MDSDFRGGVRARRPLYRRPPIVVVERYQRTRLSQPSVGVAMDIIRVQSIAQSSKLPQSMPTDERVRMAVGPTTIAVDTAPEATGGSIPVERHGGSGKQSIKSRAPYVLLAVAACVVLIIGGYLTVMAVRANRAVEQQIARLESGAQTGGPSSLPTDVKPKDPNYIENNAVAPQLPKILTITKIGVKARVVQVGVDKDGKLDVPKTAYDVGWYMGSSRPGENGAMVIDGHVQGVGGGAIFTKLKTLVAGDKLLITRGDGKAYTYTVRSVETIPVAAVDMAKLLVSADTALPGLNLITCGGTFDNSADTYTDRTIVYTTQDS